MIVFGKGLFWWPTENRSVVLKGSQVPWLRNHVLVCSEILSCPLCFDYSVYNEMIMNLRMIKTNAFTAFQQSVAGILAALLRTFHVPRFKNPGSKQNSA